MSFPVPLITPYGCDPALHSVAAVFGAPATKVERTRAPLLYTRDPILIGGSSQKGCRLTRAVRPGSVHHRRESRVPASMVGSGHRFEAGDRTRTARHLAAGRRPGRWRYSARLSSGPRQLQPPAAALGHPSAEAHDRQVCRVGLAPGSTSPPPLLGARSELWPSGPRRSSFLQTLANASRSAPCSVSKARKRTGLVFAI